MGGPPSRRFLCLFWCETRQRIFGPEISPYLEVVRGHEGELVGKELTELAWNHGRRQSTPDTGAVRPAEKIGSSEEDRVKRCRHSSCFVEFSLVTHASVSLHMHVVLHTLLLLWVNPKHCSCLFVCFIFSCPPDCILVVPRNVRCPHPRTTSWSPAGREVEWLEIDVKRVGAWGRYRYTSFQSHSALFGIFFYGVQTPEYMAMIGQPVETLDQCSQSAIIGGWGKETSPQDPCLTGQPIKNYGLALHVLGRRESSTPLFFD